MPPIKLALSLVLACTAQSSLLSAAVIDVRSGATVRAGLIHLSDVADIDDVDPQIRRQLESVSLGPAPAPGKKLRITQQAIRQRLLAHGVNLSEIEFTGQAVVLLESPGEAKPAPEPKPAVAAAAKPVAVRPFSLSPSQHKRAERIVQEAFHRQFKISSAQVGSLNLAVEIPEDDVPELLKVDSQIVRFVEPGLEWGGPQTLTAQFPRRDGSTHVVRMQAWLNETPQVLTVKHTVPKGQVVRESDLVRVPAKNGETGMEHSGEIVGQEATKSLRPGTAIQSGDTTRVPLVRNNDLVTVRSGVRGLKVTRLFRANGSGAEGDIIPCVALDDPKEKIQARVTNWHEAEVVVADVTAPPIPSQRISASQHFPAGGSP